MLLLKRKLAALLALALLLVAVLPVLANAAGEQDVLVVDRDNRYAGMSKTWAQGYLPTVSGSTAVVVLPLVLNTQAGVAALANGTVTVKPDFGSPSGSPFVFSNIEKTVTLADHAVNGTTVKKQAWLLSFSFALEKHRVNGSYPVTFHVSYTLPDGTAVTQDFTVYVTIRNGIDPNATPKPDPTPKPTAPPQPLPRLIISHYTATPSAVEAGHEFKLDFELKNTSDTVGIRNIKLTLKGDGLSPVSGSNTLYVKSLEKAATQQLSFSMATQVDAVPKQYSVAISMDYEDGSGTPYTAADEMLVQVTQSLRLEFDKPNVPTSMNAGDTAPFSLQVINKGRSAVYNVMCVLDAPGLLPESSSFLGNMDPGTAKTAQITVFAGTLGMTASDDGSVSTNSTNGNDYGKTTGTITISYEDEFGKKYSSKTNISTTINAPITPEATQAPTAQPKAGQWWVSAIIALAVIGAILLLLALNQVNRRRKVEGSEEK